MHLRFTTLTLVLMFCGLLSYVVPVEAASIMAVQNRKVLLQLNGDSATEGDLFIAVNPENGKRLGIIKITKVRNDRALGVILRGRAVKGWDAHPRGSPLLVRHKAHQEESSSRQIAFGGLLGYAMDTQSVKFSGFTANMTGNDFSAYAFADYNFSEMLGVRGFGGMDTFSVSSGDTCSGATCKTSIDYGSLGGWGRFMFYPGQINPWVGVGLAFLMPFSSSATALNTSSINTTYAFLFGGGIDWRLSPTLFIPIQAEYAMFSGTSSVSTSWIAIRAGIGINF